QRLFEITRDRGAETVEHPAHDRAPSSRSRGLVSRHEMSPFNLWPTCCIFVHITIRAFAGTPCFGQLAAINLPETLPAFRRRPSLAASAAIPAPPSLAAPAPQSDVDVVIVGAGAAGIAAARRIAASGRRMAFLEASDRIGGRCFTDMRTNPVRPGRALDPH